MNVKRRPLLASSLLATLLLSVIGFAQAQQPAGPATQNTAKTESAASSSKATPSPATAPAAVEEPDTLILSDTLNYDDAKKESIFTGNVIMTRGLMTLHSDKLVMREDADGFQFGTATVGPNKLVHIRQENPEKFEVMEAKGLRGEYDGKKEEIEMIGQAVVTRFVCGKPFDSVSGARVIYKQKNDTYEAFGGPNSAAVGGRVRSLAQPRAKAEAAAAECRKKSASTQ